MHSSARNCLRLASALCPALLMSTGVQARDLVVASWGDPYKIAWYETIVPEFEKRYDAKIYWTEGFSSQTLGKLKAQKANPEIDVAMFDDGPYQQAAQLGLCDKLDFFKIPNVDNLLPAAREAGETGVHFAIIGVGLWYNENVFAENKWAPPTSFHDLFRPEFNKRISSHTIANSVGLMTLLAFNDMFGGSTPDNMEPGFAKMKEFAKRVVTFDQFGETPTLIQQEATVMGAWGNDRTWNLHEVAGVPVKFVFPKEGVYGWRESACIPAGRPKESVDLAHKFINMMLSKEQQEANAKRIGFIPLHPGVTGYGTEDELRQIKFIDWSKVNPHRSAWTERWAKEVERKK